MPPEKMKFVDPEKMAFVKKIFPHFDFEKWRTSAELCSIMRTCGDINANNAHSAAIQRRMFMIKENNVGPGSKLSLRGNLETVKKISKSGHILFEGLRGAFNPIGFFAEE